MKATLYYLFALFQTLAGQALSLPVDCDSAALRAAKAYDIPPQVMLAITRVETGRRLEDQLQPWPWAVNHSGTSHWFDTPQEAEDFVHSAVARGENNLDIGCFQLNLRWHGEAFSSLKEMFDPDQNADYAAQFLMENHQRKGNWVDAVAAYHSETPQHAKTYIEKVETVLADLANADETHAPERLPIAERTNSFPFLKPGGNGSFASLVPTGSSVRPFLLATP